MAQALTHAAAEVGGGARGAGPVVEDVAPAPRGAALGSSVLPLLIAGILTGVLSTLLATGVLARAALVVTGSVLSGLVATAIVQSWLDVVGGDWAANAAVLSLTVLAIASIVAGLKSLFGEAGAALGALTMVLIGNPFSAVATAPELLPRPAGGIGQLLPPGAGAEPPPLHGLLRRRRRRRPHRGPGRLDLRRPGPARRRGLAPPDRPGPGDGRGAEPGLIHAPTASGQLFRLSLND